MGDLAGIENDCPPANHEVWTNIALRQAEFFGGQQRDNDPPGRAAEPIGLDNDNKRNGALIAAWVAVNT